MNNHVERFDALKKALLLDNNNKEALEKFWVATELSKKYFDCADFMSSTCC